MTGAGIQSSEVDSLIRRIIVRWILRLRVGIKGCTSR